MLAFKAKLQKIEEIVANHLVDIVDCCNQSPGMFKLEMRSDQPQVNCHQLETLDFVDSVNDFREQSFDEVSGEKNKENCNLLVKSRIQSLTGSNPAPAFLELKSA